MSSLSRDDAVRAAFNEWCRRTNVRFAPYMGSVDDAFAEWQRSYPDEVAAALAKAPSREETVYEKSARWAWPDGRPDL